MDERDTNTVAHEPRPRDILCVYSQADESFYLQLKRSLNLWERQGHVHWLELRPGDELAATWQSYVKRADLILLLLSPDFFPDELCYQTMHLALQERAARQVPVVPILVRAVNWRLSECRDLAIVPRNEQAIASWSLPDEAYASINIDLVRLVPLFPPIPSPTRPRLFQARDLPKGYVPRPNAFDEIKSLLLYREGNQTMAITTALRGAGGFGKTTLALALCHDPEIQAAFPDGILWVELGEQPPRTLDLLNGVLHALEPSLSLSITLGEARDRWRTALEGRVCLLVIDDVWQAIALSPLLEGGPQCVRLVTTRNDQVLPEETVRVWVDAMEPDEAIAVLRRGLPQESYEQVPTSQWEALVTRLGYWPLLLALANGMLTSFVSYGQSVDSALVEVERLYEARGVTAFQLDQLEARQGTADACLQISVQHVERFTRPHYHAAERYQELAVFPEDTDIPIATLQIFWQGTEKLELGETKDLCIRLHRLSLLLTCDLGKGMVRLHDVMRNYLVQRAGAQMSALHTRLLSAYWQDLGLRRWADLPKSDTYIWQHLILHLCQTGNRRALETTLTDLMYLTREVLYVGVVALERDLMLARRTDSAQGVTDSSSLFESLHRRIVGISHLLQQVRTEAEIGGLLLSHLGTQPAFAAQQGIFERDLARPHLSAWHPLPKSDSPALLRTLHGHTASVLGCAVSPDGGTIVSASADDTLKVWDWRTGTERLTLAGHTDSVFGCAVSADGHTIVSASYDKTLKVWDRHTGALRLTLAGHSYSVSGCAVNADGRIIVSASDDHTLKVWDGHTGALRLTLAGHTDSVSGCAVSADGHTIVSASDDHTLKVWDGHTGALRLTLSGHTERVKDCAVSADGRTIVSASHDKTLKVWDGHTGAERLTLAGHTNWINGCAVSADGRTIVSASDDKTLKVWDGHTGALRLTLSGHTERVKDCAVSADGRTIVSASFDDTLKVWDGHTEALRRTLAGHTNPVYRCAMSADGHTIVSASDNSKPKVWDGRTGTERRTLATAPVKDCAVSADGHTIITASDDKTLKVWDGHTGALRLTLSGHTAPGRCCAMSADGHTIVSASYDKTLKVWDGHTGALRLTLSGHTAPVNGCAVSADGRTIVSASGDPWGSDHTLKVWDGHTGAERLTLSGHTAPVEDCAVSADGRTIVSSSWDHTLKVWDGQTGALRLTLTRHTAPVRGCAMSADGRTIISASNDHTLKMWDGQTGQCMLTFPVDGAIFGCAFSLDGEHLVACGDQGMYFLRLVT